ASGSGQQVQGQGQAVKVVIAERRQVIKAALRGLVEAAQPDLSPAEVDAVVAEVSKRMTMGSKQCVLAAVMSLTVLLLSFLGQPTPGFPAAAGPAPGPPPPPDPDHPPYAHPRIPTRISPRTAAAPAQLPPPVQLGIWDPQLLAQIRDAMELITKASVIEHLMRGPHHHGIRLLPAQDPPAPAPAQAPPPPPPAQAPPAQAPPPAPPAQAQPLPAAPGPAPRPQAPPWGRWLDRDTNGCLNLQRIGESRQRPIELCQWDDLEALPPVGSEYQQRYKRVNDRLPKGRQWLHRAAEYRRGIDGRARNNALGPSSFTQAVSLTKHNAVSFDEEPSGLSRESATRVGFAVIKGQLGLSPGWETWGPYCGLVVDWCKGLGVEVVNAFVTKSRLQQSAMKGKKHKGADEPKEPTPKQPKPKPKGKPDTVGWVGLVSLKGKARKDRLEERATSMGYNKVTNKIVAHFWLRVGIHHKQRKLASLGASFADPDNLAITAKLLELDKTELAGDGNTIGALAKQMVVNTRKMFANQSKPRCVLCKASQLGLTIATAEAFEAEHAAYRNWDGVVKRHVAVTLATSNAVWGEYLHPEWAEQKLRLHGTKEKVLERYFKKRWGTRKQLVVFFSHAGIGTPGGWGAKDVLPACRKVVERANSGKPIDRVPGKVVTVDEFRTSRVSSAVNSPQSSIALSGPEAWTG
ncbi:hypothetical protein QJQ45_021274, partial [Haematococcus lacustris]